MSEGGVVVAYSQITDEQLDALEEANPALYGHVLDVCETIAEDPGGSQLRALTIQTTKGIRFRIGVPSTGISAFWSLGDDGPRIEAVFPRTPSSR